MKIIDADDVMERIEQAYKDMGVDTHGIWNKQLAEIFKAEETDVEDIRMCLHKILGAVAQAPSADRPQGEWIEQEDCWQCSECGDEFVLEVDVKPIDARMHYCPNCGARMKGADDEY